MKFILLPSIVTWAHPREMWFRGIFMAWISIQSETYFKKLFWLVNQKQERTNTWIAPPPIILAFLCMYIFQDLRCTHMILFVQTRLQINEVLIFHSTWRAFVQHCLLSQQFHALSFHFSSYIVIINIFYFLYSKLFPYHTYPVRSLLSVFIAYPHAVYDNVNA